MENETEVENIVMANNFFSKIKGMEQSRIDLLAIAIPSLMVTIAEMLLFAGRTKLSIWMHLILLIILTLSTIIFEDRDRKHVLRAFILISLLRILNLSMPVFFDMTLYSYAFIYAPLIISIYVVIKDQELSYSYLGITRNRRYYEMPVALMASVVIATGEFLIIKPGYLIPDLSAFNLLKLSIIMILFVGLVEELIFRSILQAKLEEMIGKYQGLILASILFGVMHSGYGTPYEIAFTAFAGFVMGGIYIIRRDLLLVTMVHGFVNILLFGILPHMA